MSAGYPVSVMFGIIKNNLKLLGVQSFTHSEKIIKSQEKETLAELSEAILDLKYEKKTS